MMNKFFYLYWWSKSETFEERLVHSKHLWWMFSFKLQFLDVDVKIVTVYTNKSPKLQSKTVQYIRTLIWKFRIIIISWQYILCSNVILLFKASNKYPYLSNINGEVVLCLFANLIESCLQFQCLDYWICLLEYVIEEHFVPTFFYFKTFLYSLQNTGNRWTTKSITRFYKMLSKWFGSKSFLLLEYF